MGWSRVAFRSYDGVEIAGYPDDEPLGIPACKRNGHARFAAQEERPTLLGGTFEITISMALFRLATKPLMLRWVLTRRACHPLRVRRASPQRAYETTKATPRSSSHLRRVCNLFRSSRP